MSSPRNLILTAAVHYDIAALRPFVMSWRRNVPNTDLVVFANHLAPATVEWLIAQGVEVLPGELHAFRNPRGWRKALQQMLLASTSGLFAAVLRRICGPADVRPRQIRDSLISLNGARWRYYDLFLRLHGWRYSSVFFADARDTVFQADPFPATGLHVFAEQARIGDSHFARRWFQLTYGGATWRRLAGDDFLCSGTTLGAVPAAAQYVAAMSAEIARVLAIGGEDQAVHNFLMHTGRIAATRHAFGAGAAVSLNAVPLTSLRVANGQLLDAQGLPYPVVHQYDRVPGLAAELTATRL